MCTVLEVSRSGFCAWFPTRRAPKLERVGSSWLKSAGSTKQAGRPMGPLVPQDHAGASAHRRLRVGQSSLAISTLNQEPLL